MFLYKRKIDSIDFEYGTLFTFPTKFCEISLDELQRKLGLVSTQRKHDKENERTQGRSEI